MTFTVDKHVLRLNVSMNDAVLVQVCDGEQNLGKVDPCMVFGQVVITSCNLVLGHELSDVATGAEVRDKVQVVESLKRVV